MLRDCVDLKKTVAVLLENMLDRVHVVEERLKKLSAFNHSAVTASAVVRPAESLLISTDAAAAAPANGNSVNARGVLDVKFLDALMPTVAIWIQL